MPRTLQEILDHSEGGGSPAVRQGPEGARSAHLTSRFSEIGGSTPPETRTVVPLVSEPQALTQDQIEDALTKTLYGWADELDTGRKFWWADWAKLIGDAITAVRTGEPVLYPEDD